jgi:hypothetical protein
MAWIESVRYMTDYPALYGLVTRSIPALPRLQPRVFRAFMRYTKLAEADALDAIRPNVISPPVIRVTQMLDKERYAYYPGSGDVIIVQRSFLVDAESAIATGFTGARMLLESKIMHEMVHWGWFRTTMSRYEPQSKYGYDDYGWDFERDAWGRPLTVYTMGLAHVIPDPLIPLAKRMAAP